MSELLARLRHFEEDRKNSADEYGAELIYRTINRIKELEARDDKYWHGVMKRTDKQAAYIRELEAKLQRIEDRMKTIKAGSEPPYANLLQRDRNMVHIVIEDLEQSLKENDDE